MPALNCALATTVINKSKRPHNSPRPKAAIVRVITSSPYKPCKVHFGILIVKHRGRRNPSLGYSPSASPSRLALFGADLDITADSKESRAVASKTLVILFGGDRLIVLG